MGGVSPSTSTQTSGSHLELFNERPRLLQPLPPAGDSAQPAATATLAVVGMSCEGAFRQQWEKPLLLLLRPPPPHHGGRRRDLERFRTGSGADLGFRSWSSSASDWLRALKAGPLRAGLDLSSATLVWAVRVGPGSPPEATSPFPVRPA